MTGPGSGMGGRQGTTTRAGAAPGAAPVEPAGPAERQVSRKLLEVLVCPASGARLEYDAERQELVSRAAGLAFPIRSGVPVMLIDDARHLES